MRSGESVGYAARTLLAIQATRLCRCERRPVALTVIPSAHTVSGRGPTVPKAQWTMPPLALLARPQWSTGRKVAMLTLRGYLLASMILLIVKAIQLGGG